LFHGQDDLFVGVELIERGGIGGPRVEGGISGRKVKIYRPKAKT
jgi:hypothetical protein